MNIKSIIEKYKPLYEKHKDVIPYLIFGVLTTLVNIGAYWITAHPLKLSTTLSTCIAWVVSVIFAYVTNRIWVFHSTASGFLDIAKEVGAFFACRLATGLMDLFFMWFFVDVLHFNDLIIKVLSNIVVVVLNYVASKLMIFKKSK